MYGADPPVEHGPDRERQALVGDLLGHHVLEQVGLFGLLVEGDQLGRPQGVEMIVDRLEGPESG